MTPENLLALASVKPRQAVTGPTEYRALRPTIGIDGTRYQLAERVSNDARVMLVSRDVAGGDLVPAVNARNVTRHAIDAKLKVLRDAKGGAAEAVAARASEVERLTAERSALPSIDAHPTQPVAAPLAVYQEMAEQEAAKAEQEAAQEAAQAEQDAKAA